jgi:hypothetical protein
MCVHVHSFRINETLHVFIVISLFIYKYIYNRYFLLSAPFETKAPTLAFAKEKEKKD